MLTDLTHYYILKSFSQVKKANATTAHIQNWQIQLLVSSVQSQQRQQSSCCFHPSQNTKENIFQQKNAPITSLEYHHSQD